MEFLFDMPHCSKLEEVEIEESRSRSTGGVSDLHYGEPEAAADQDPLISTSLMGAYTNQPDLQAGEYDTELYESPDGPLWLQLKHVPTLTEGTVNDIDTDCLRNNVRAIEENMPVKISESSSSVNNIDCEGDPFSEVTGAAAAALPFSVPNDPLLDQCPRPSFDDISLSAPPIASTTLEFLIPGLGIPPMPEISENSDESKLDIQDVDALLIASEPSLELQLYSDQTNMNSRVPVSAESIMETQAGATTASIDALIGLSDINMVGPSDMSLWPVLHPSILNPASVSNDLTSWVQYGYRSSDSHYAACGISSGASISTSYVSSERMDNYSNPSTSQFAATSPRRTRGIAETDCDIEGENAKPIANTSSEVDDHGSPPAMMAGGDPDQCIMSRSMMSDPVLGTSTENAGHDSSMGIGRKRKLRLTGKGVDRRSPMTRMVQMREMLERCVERCGLAPMEDVLKYLMTEENGMKNIKAVIDGTGAGGGTDGDVSFGFSGGSGCTSSYSHDTAMC